MEIKSFSSLLQFCLNLVEGGLDIWGHRNIETFTRCEPRLLKGALDPRTDLAKIRNEQCVELFHVMAT